MTATDFFWQELGGTLFEEAGDALFLFDPDSEQIRDANPMSQRLTGFTRRELLDAKLTDMVRAEVEGGMQRMRIAFRRTGVFHSQEGFFLRHKSNGHWVPVNLTITRLHTDSQTVGLLTARDITERREAMARLRESEQRHRLLLEQMPAIVWTTDAELRTLSSAGAGLAKLGERPNQHAGKLLTEILGTDDPNFLPIAAHRRALAGETVTYEMEWRGRAWQTHIEPLHGPNGKIVGTVGMCFDTTERMQAEHALRESQRTLATLMSNLPGMAYRCRNDPNWSMEFVSEGSVDLTGYRPDDLVGNRAVAFADLIHADDRDMVWNEVQRGLQTNQPFRIYYRIRTAAGAEKWVWEQGRGIVDAAGQLVALEGFITDITERKRAEEALRGSEAKYRTLIENLTQSIFLKDRDLRFVAVNQPFCRAFAKPAAEIIGKDDFALSPPHLAEKYRADDRKVLQERKRLELEEHTLLHGKLRTVQVVKSPVLDSDGQAVGVLGIFWDVTEQRNLEAQLRQAHKMEAVGQLAGGIAHDFNNLLTGIIGNLALALADLPQSHPARELLSSAETAAVRAAELTRQLLGFSRRTPLLSRPLNLNTVLDETLRLVRRTFDPRIEVRVASQPDLWAIQSDAAQMGQVLMNLCLNARDAMPQGGILTLQTDNVHLDAETAARSLEGKPGDFVHLQVQDTGTGMPPQVRERIFEPFFTTKEQGKGTGLGLAMVFGILKQHQGWIECSSEVGRGTTFDIYLPAVPAAAAPSEAALPGGIRGGSETILLADDEEVVSRLGETILRRHGYRVLMAADGVEAVDIYRREAADIDLVILDLSMPRLSGPETLLELRRINPAVPVLISSGYSTDENLRAVEREGVLGFVAKPYRPAEFARQVRAALDRGKK